MSAPTPTPDKKQIVNWKQWKLIPLDEITDFARKIAVAWCDGFESDLGIQIEQRHKLASDIMNYAQVVNLTLSESNLEKDKEIERLKEENKELGELLMRNASEFEDMKIEIEALKETQGSMEGLIGAFEHKLSGLSASHKELYEALKQAKDGLDMEGVLSEETEHEFNKILAQAELLEKK